MTPIKTEKPEPKKPNQDSETPEQIRERKAREIAERQKGTTT